ncbi:MAG TPA: class I SAM-dependent methyltransferase [Thermoplasmata archaeon]|nr:class I SAM-dependent methyltransferase [Thermoplasmata archaeon]
MSSRGPPGRDWAAGSRPGATSQGETVPVLNPTSLRPAILSPAARKAIRQRMLFLRSASLERIRRLTGVGDGDLLQYRRELRASGLPDTLLRRGAGLAFTHELPQGALLYLLVRAAKPDRVVETGVRPGYTTAWILGALDAAGRGELVSLGPGTTAGRAAAVQHVSVGQFVPPSLRSRWTLALGNSEGRLREILASTAKVDLFLYDNGPDASRARFELRAAWDALSPRGVLVAHRVDASPAWAEFCGRQGVPPQILDPGPPPMGALGVRASAG